MPDEGHEAAPTYRALTRNADALLDEMFKRKIPESTVRKSVERAMDANDLEWLQELITTMQNRIQAHDDEHRAAATHHPAPALSPQTAASSAAPAEQTTRLCKLSKKTQEKCEKVR